MTTCFLTGRCKELRRAWGAMVASGDGCWIGWRYDSGLCFNSMLGRLER